MEAWHTDHIEKMENKMNAMNSPMELEEKMGDLKLDSSREDHEHEIGPIIGNDQANGRLPSVGSRSDTMEVE